MKAAGAASGDLWRVPLEALVLREGYNPRLETQEFLDGIDQLAQSIAAHGFYDDKPIGIYVAKEGGVDVLYVEDGHRRTRAARLAVEKYGASIETLPAVQMPRSMSPEKRLLHMYRSNNDGVPFQPLEQAIIVQRFEAFGWSVDTISKEMGITKTRVQQLQTLASSPKEIRDFVKNGEISATLAIETQQAEGSDAAGLIKEAVQEAKKTGKKATAKTVKEVKKRKGRPSKKELAAKSERLVRKHAPEAFELLTAIFKKHGKVIDEDFHKKMDHLVVTTGYVEE